MLFLEPFDGGSHRAFAHGWVTRSRHRITLETLPARFWKWRLRGAAFAFAERVTKRAGLGRTGTRRTSAGRAVTLARSSGAGGALGATCYDAIFATSLMNAADFMAASGIDAPLIVYFHENQLSYPRPPDEPLDHGLALAALSSAAAADAVVFNSAFHRKAFLQGLEEWTRRFPEFAPVRTAASIRRKTSVIHPGIDWAQLAPLATAERRQREDRDAPLSVRGQHRNRGTPIVTRRGAAASRGRGIPDSSRAIPSSRGAGAGGPLILWNHRWEFDKNPTAFFAALELLAARGWDFRLALLGENTQFVPKPFLAARERFGPRIVRFGYEPSAAAYRGWLGRADIVVSTAHQENFGLSVAEAVAAGAFPLLPARLSYPELLPKRLHAECLYRSQSDLVHRLERLLAHPERLAAGRLSRSQAMRRYDWSIMAPALDDLVAAI